MVLHRTPLVLRNNYQQPKKNTFSNVRGAQLASRSPVARAALGRTATTRHRHFGSPKGGKNKRWSRLECDENELSATLSTGFRGLDQATAADDDITSENEGSVNEDPFDWDEPSTLVEFMEGRVAPSVSSKAVVDNLGPALQGEGPRLAQDMAYAISPGVQAIRRTYDTVQNKMDDAFGAGFVAFDAACQMVEKLCLKERDDVHQLAREHELKLKNLIEGLQQARAAHEALWDNYHSSATRVVTDAKNALEALPRGVEDRISYWEKKSKDLEKENQSSLKASQDMLSNFLGNMS